MLDFRWARARLDPARCISILVALTLVVGILVSVARPAVADTAPTTASTPATVSADALPTVQVNGVVWAQVTVGNTVYATGSFTQTWPAGQSASASNQTPRSNLLAYDITTGALITSFNHTLNAQGLAISASPDGSTVYVAGDFTTVDGTTRNHIAAFSTATGALSGFAPSISGSTESVTSTNSTVYVGGNFFSAGGTPRTRLAAFTSGGALLSWAPTADDNQVTALAISPDGSRVIVGGRFTTLDGQSAVGLGAVDATSGALLSFPANAYIQDGAPASNTKAGCGITSLEVQGSQVFGTGFSYYCGNFEGRFALDGNTGAINWVNDCHGDSYDAAAIGSVLYSVGHAHDCSAIGGFPDTNPRTWHRAVAETTYPTGTDTGPDNYGWNYNGLPDSTQLDWYPTISAGTYTGQNQGAWSVSGNANYISLGGEFPTVNGAAQAGLVRFAVSSLAPNKVGPQVVGSNWKLTAVSLSSGSVRVSFPSNWDPDNATLTYKVYRDASTGTPIYTTTANSTFWQLPTLGFTDTGLVPGSTHQYKVYATDPYGNTTSSLWVNATVSAAGPSAPSTYAQDVARDGALDYWRLGETTGSTAYDYAGFDDMTENNGPTQGAAGSIAHDAGTATTFNGSNQWAATGDQIAAPNTFSVEGWFNTTSTSGGVIAGFGDSASALSSNYDRHIYMDPAGHLSFGVYNGGAYTVSTSNTYNDGQWHYVVGTLSGAGVVFYVDGKLVGTNAGTTVGQAYNGYWRIGGDNVAGWPNAGANYFAGSIDDVAVYPTALSLAQVRAHYLDAGGSIPAYVPAPSDAYGKAVYGDGPTSYFRMDESSGTVANDASGNGNAGTYYGTETFGAASPVTGGSGTAVAFSGTNGSMLSTNQPQAGPSTYSEELWFNTTTTTGGKLVGFGDSQSGTSGSYDRQVYMTDSGQLSFGVYTGATVTATSPKSYNDGTWHYLVATQGPGGMTLYVDGSQVATNPTTTAQSYTGYWRIGGDNLSGWPVQPDSDYFAGGIDEAAVYPVALSAAQVAAHYAASPAGQPAPTPPAASFTSNASNLGVAFDASASSAGRGVAGYAWNFGDGSTGSGVAPTHVFAASGTYSVQLTVTDTSGATNSVTHTVAVKANMPPIASFTPTCTALTCSFDATASRDPDGSIASYSWVFGDGSSGSGSTVSHQFAVAGDYTVTLTVTDNQGATGTSSQTLSPRPAANPATAPYATDSFARTVTGGLGTADQGGAWTSAGNAAGQSVRPGVASLVSKAGQTTAAYLSGVSSTDTDTVATITSDKAGVSGYYLDVIGRRVSSTVDYRARIRQGANGSVTAAILAVNGTTTTVLGGEKTVPAVTYGAGTKLSVRLQASGTNPTTLRLKVWATGTSEPAAWLVTTTDSTSALQAKGSVGLSSYLTSSAANGPVTMQVSSFTAQPTASGPTAAFTVGCSGMVCSTDGSSSTSPGGNIVAWQWGWGDGTASTGSTSPHTFTAPGTYRITLTVTDNNAATNVTTRTVTVPA